MTFSLRLSDDLTARAREKCDRMGISMNSLVSVALDAYLGGAGALPRFDTGQALAAAAVSSEPRPALSNRERKRLAALRKK